MTEDPRLQDLPTDPHERADAMFEIVMAMPPAQGMGDRFNYDHVFGDLWSRPDLDIRTRRVVSIVSAALTAADLPLQSHMVAAMRSGDLSVEELREIGVHMGQYAGLSRGVSYAMVLAAAEASLE